MARTSEEALTAGRWHPGTPMALAAAAVLSAFAPWASLPVGLLGPLALAVLIGIAPLLSGRSAFRRWLAVLLAGWLPLSLSMMLVHGLFFPEGQEVIASLGPARITREGLAFGSRLAARYGLVFSGFGLAVALASLDGLARVVEGMPGALGLAHPIRAAFGLLPAARRRAAGIRDAQRARGMRADTPLSRVRAVGPLIVPLAASLLSDADTRAATLASRGYRSNVRPTSLIPLADSSLQRWVRVAAPTLALLFLIATHLWVALSDAPAVGG